MSVFNFEIFGAGHIPPFTKFIFDIKEGKSKLQATLSDDIEDVEYVDVSESPEITGKDRQSLSYDKEARDAEIFEYASKKKPRNSKKNDPYFELSFGVLFSIGAHWADDNPISKFHNLFERTNAFLEEIDKIQKEMESNAGKKLPDLSMILICSVSLGFHWADKNPPKYH